MVLCSTKYESKYLNLLIFETHKIDLVLQGLSTFTCEETTYLVRESNLILIVSKILLNQ